MTSQPLRQPRTTTPTETLYFAYGSNLHLTQMARRCPSARYVGPAHLHGYRFQINQRGYANIVSSSPPDFVAGLCYLLSKDDEEKLDVNEGVAVGAYEKEVLGVKLFFPNAALLGRLVSEIVEGGLIGGLEAAFGDVDGDVGKGDVTKVGPGNNEDDFFDYRRMIPELGLEPHAAAVFDQETLVAGERAPVPVPFTSQQTATNRRDGNSRGEIVRALVYVSRRYTTEGRPWEEYIERMNLGIADAVRLGVSDEYVENYVRRYISKR